jgi:TPP-dependent pyruvate/acetoin dehydrogenase alpha subunit
MDMDVGVKRSDELRGWLPKDPIARTGAQLVELGMTYAKIEELEREVRLEIQNAIRFARESSYPPESDLKKHVFVDLQVAN